jgi:hypothetical protein
MGLEPSAREVIVWMSKGGRPASAPAPVVEVAFDDEVIGSATPDDTMRPFTFPLPADLARRVGASGEPARLRLRVQPWSPSIHLGANDTRELGVIVTRVQAR